MYFLTDLVWVTRVPICVKSPGVIIKVRTNETKRNDSFVPIFFDTRMLISRFFLTTTLFVLYRAASHCRHSLSLGSFGVAGIPLVHGSLPFGGNQYLVPHSTKGRLQIKGEQLYFKGSGDCMFLRVVDCHSLLGLSRDYGCIFAKGARRSGGFEYVVALALYLSAGSFISLFIEFQVDL